MPQAHGRAERLPRRRAARRGFVGRRRARATLRGARPATPGSTCRRDAAAGHLRTADQQQVEILRALARDAALIVMDEPTAALSRAGRGAAARDRAARSRPAGRTVVLISHFLARGARARRHGHGAARRPARPDRARRPTRPRTSLDRRRCSDGRSSAGLPAEGGPRPPERRRSCRGSRRSARPASTGSRSRCAAGEIVGPRGARRRRARPSSPGRSSAPTRSFAGEVAARLARAGAGGSRPAADALRLGRRDDPRVAQGRGAAAAGRSVRENATLCASLGALQRGSASSPRRARAPRAAEVARALRTSRRRRSSAGVDRSRAATSRRCCSPGCCSASRDC